MTLSALIRGRGSRQLATAIPAIFATDSKKERETVARIATVAVAKPRKDEPAPLPKVGASGTASRCRLSDLIRKRGNGSVATAIPAIDGQERARTVATVAVAKPLERKVSSRDTAADFDREWFEERAAIYEFNAGYPRHEAERLAMMEVSKWTH